MPPNPWTGPQDFPVRSLGATVRHIHQKVALLLRIVKAHEPILMNHTFEPILMNQCAFKNSGAEMIDSGGVGPQVQPSATKIVSRPAVVPTWIEKSCRPNVL
jgi:hypothetical protein